jgi:DNA-directed RNA polymerase subunit M/transcription elongation factor TFIIS
MRSKSKKGCLVCGALMIEDRKRFSMLVCSKCGYRTAEQRMNSVIDPAKERRGLGPPEPWDNIPCV